MSRLRYEIVDVFTDRPFAGNPLAVVFDADGLEAGQLQAIAKEFNLSETVFPMPPTTNAATYRLRIFTPSRELPFAGHPSVGAAVVQLRRGLIPAGEVVQECGAGLLPVRVDENGALLTGGPPTLGPEAAAGPFLKGLGLAETDLVGPLPRRAGCGLEFWYVQVARRALADPSPSGARDDIDLFAWDPATRTAYSRVFALEAGVVEDPATGSAALGLGVYLVGTGQLPADGTTSYTVHQGHEMGRPSRLDCTVTTAGGAVTAATVSGQVVAIGSGEIAVPPR